MQDTAMDVESPPGDALANDPWAELERGLQERVAAERDAPGLSVVPDLARVRSPRVGFKHAVRVAPVGSPRAYRVLSSNLSRDGMFLAMPTPLEPGTHVALSLEAGGRVLPFAEAEVRWSRLAGDAAGAGVRFVTWRHPRAHELVEFLVANLATGRPLPRPEVRRSAVPRLLRAQLAVACLAAVAGVVFLSWRWSGSAAPPPAVERAAAPAPVTPAPAPAKVAEAPVAPARAFADVAPVKVRPRAAAKPPARTGAAQVIRLSAAGAAAGLSVETARGGLLLRVEPAANGKVASVSTLDGPPRVVFDLEGGAPARNLAVTLDGKLLKQVRVGRLGEGTRVVVDLVKMPARATQAGAAALLSF